MLHDRRFGYPIQTLSHESISGTRARRSQLYYCKYRYHILTLYYTSILSTRGNHTHQNYYIHSMLVSVYQVLEVADRSCIPTCIRITFDHRVILLDLPHIIIDHIDLRATHIVVCVFSSHSYVSILYLSSKIKSILHGVG
jgi:hypothetical protein